MPLTGDASFWKGRRVFLTGHTGFKGSWMSLWLAALGAKVTGYSLDPPTKPNMFTLCRVDDVLARSVIADVRDAATLARTMRASRPEVAIHMAAQPLVRESYRSPAETYAVNVMGAVNFHEAARRCAGLGAMVNVTTDKCYENRERARGYREGEPLGGYDPYSSSKACSELVTAAYRTSFFHPGKHSVHGVGIASARAGNVIGGGDWGRDRLVPDCIRALLKGEKARIRNPAAVRPWQHVVEPLGGYLLLARRLCEDGARFSGAWNFGPDPGDAKRVDWVVKTLCRKWGRAAGYTIDAGPHPHEARFLRLDCAKARSELSWRPRWNIGTAIDKVVEWTRAYRAKQDLPRVCLGQIEEYSRGEGRGR